MLAHFFYIRAPLNLHLDPRLNGIIVQDCLKLLILLPLRIVGAGRDAPPGQRGSGSGYAAVSDIGSYTMHLPTPTRIVVMVNR